MRGFLEQHVPSVYRFALRLTGSADAADDLTQETFLRAWRHRRRRRRRDETAVRVWLFSIARNARIDDLRRLRVRQVAEEGPTLAPARPPEPGPAAGAIQRERIDEALAAIEALPERQRQVLHLSACEGLSNADIARVLDITPGAVKSSLSLARDRVRAALTETTSRTAHECCAGSHDPSP